MGLIVAKLKKPIRRFNIDNRARAIIEQDKPTPAPQYEAAKRQLKLAQEISPDFLEKHYQKNLELDEHLKKVYVTSPKPQEDDFGKPDPNRPLPKLRISEDFEFGFYMPNKAPLGKCTLRQIFDLLSRHKEDTVKYNEEALATQYKLDKETVAKLLNYYKLYHLVIPKKESVDEDEKIDVLTDKWFYAKIGRKEKE